VRRPPGRVRRLAIKGRHVIRAAAATLRRKVTLRRPTVELEHVQRRLELLLMALYGQSIGVAPVHTRPLGWADRVARALSRDPRSHEPTPEVGLDDIRLPASLHAGDGDDAAVARFRLLAVEQAERLTRGTANHAPHSDALERDLYLLREGAAIDARIARLMPRLHDSLAEERFAALVRRPHIDGLTPKERAVERLLRSVLESPPETDDVVSATPGESLAWAKDMAATIRRERGRYRGIPPARLWGSVRPPTENVAPTKNASAKKTMTRPNPLSSATDVGGAYDDTSSDAQQRVADGRSDDVADDSRSRKEREKEDETKSSPIADATQNDLVELVQLRDAPPTSSQNKGATLSTARAVVADTDPAALAAGIPYDEWDADARRYRPRAAIVRLSEAKMGTGLPPIDVRERHGALVRQIRHRFERLRARRILLGRQRSGDELDIAACVDATVDRRIGHAPDDRLYVDARPARRGFAISLLVDVSGSTETRVTAELKIIDLERLALVLASEALDALGDLYSITAFTGKGPDNVIVTTVKRFDETSGDTTRRRIAALTPGGFTRLGAAVRHCTRQLAHQTAGHRLLLILSDGRPNDYDRYQGTYGIEDSRQAIMEARASGVFPFCLTVDRDASEYLPHIFGTAGHTILRRPEQLPTALLSAVTALVRRPG
jgi:nitric oxide reductase NorD protein